MERIAQADTRNMLIAKLAVDDFDLLQPYLKRVPHCSHDTLANPGGRIDHAWFPEGAVTAFLTIMTDESRVAVGLVGWEGMIGCAALEGAERWRYEVCVRAADSTALRIDVDRLIAACMQSPRLQRSLLRYTGNYSMQVGRTSVSNLIDPVERRMARWILLYHDRVETDEVTMTHQEMSIMLGVRRASATDALHLLEGKGALRSLRGRIVVRDRALLEAIAGEAYGDVEADYRALIGPFGKGVG